MWVKGSPILRKSAKDQFFRAFLRGFSTTESKGSGASRGTIVPALLSSGASTTDGTSFAFGDSQTPASNTFLLMAVLCSHASAAEVPNSITAYGLTWTQCVGTASGTTTCGNALRRLTWFYSWGAASTGTVTVGFATSHTGCTYAVVSLPGAALAANQQSTANTTAGATTLTGTLGALEYSLNVHIYGLGRAIQEATSPPAAGGWAELVDHATTSYATPATALEIGWAVTDLTADPTWTTAGGAGIVSLEIKAS